MPGLKVQGDVKFRNKYRKCKGRGAARASTVEKHVLSERNVHEVAVAGRYCSGSCRSSGAVLTVAAQATGVDSTESSRVVPVRCPTRSILPSKLRPASRLNRLHRTFYICFLSLSIPLISLSLYLFLFRVLSPLPYLFSLSFSSSPLCEFFNL